MKVVFIGCRRRAHYLHLTITSFNSYLKCFWRTRSSSRYLSCLENSQQTFNTMETRHSRVLGGYFSNRILIFLFIPAQLVRCFAVCYFLNIYELLSSNVDITAPLYACFRDRSVFPKNQAYRKERSFEEGQQTPVWVVSSEELVSVVCLSRWFKIFTRASGIRARFCWRPILLFCSQNFNCFHAMGDPQLEVLQYVPFKSFVQASFWHKLAEIKIDVDKLSDGPREIYGYYTNANAKECLFEVDYSAFNR